MKHLQKTYRLSFLFWVSLYVFVSCATNTLPPKISPTGTTSEVVSETKALSGAITPSSSSWLIFPIDQALSRVTKKTFWLWITPKTSPVSPERFQGYHAWTDFETLPSEQESDIAVQAICTGPLMLKKWATGYGGVAVQKCKIDSQDVTVIYGHLKLESISASVNTSIWAWEKLAVLGKGFSHETDGERKHLHLGIHLWSVIDIRGYTSTRAELKAWMDPLKYLPK